MKRSRECRAFPAGSHAVLLRLLCSDVVKKMLTDSGLEVSSCAALAVPAAFAQEPGRASLALNVQQLRLPFQATISVPVDARVSPGEGRNQWRLHIRAASNPAMYPTFDGVLALLSAAGSGAQLQLDGRYTVPLGPIGRAIDMTALRGAARSSLRRFVRELAYRVAALARWACLE